MAAHWLQAPRDWGKDCKHLLFLGKGRAEECNPSRGPLTLRVEICQVRFNGTEHEPAMKVTTVSFLKLTFVVLILFPVAQLQPFRSGRTLHSSPSRHGCIWHHHFCSTIEAVKRCRGQGASSDIHSTFVHFVCWPFSWCLLYQWKCLLAVYQQTTHWFRVTCCTN